MQVEATIGARIGVERKLRGLTQQQLASRAHVSLSLLRKVEQGSRPSSSALTAAAAKALGLEQSQLTGQPYYSGDRRTDALHELIPALRRELTMFGVPPDADPDVPLSVTAAAARVAESSELLFAVDYARVGRLLPALLADLRALAEQTTGAEHQAAMLLLHEAYDTAKRLAYDLGYPDLGLLAISNEERAAHASGDPLAVAVTAAVRAWALTGSGAFGAAYRLLVATIDDLDGQPITPQRWSVSGFLNLQAALASARSGDAPRTWDHYAAATRAATELGEDRDDYRLTFGPTNTAIWGVGLAVELQDGAGALQRAASVVLPDDLPRSRAGHHFMDLARGHLYNGDHAGALGAMLTAKRITPQQVRYNPMARETVYALARAERRSTESLRGLAVWMGVPD